MDRYGQFAESIIGPWYDLIMLQIVLDYTMPVFPSHGIQGSRKISHISRIHEIKVSAIEPTFLHDLVLEDAPQDYRVFAVVVFEVISVDDSSLAAHSEHIDIFVFAVFA
jgi:hypothetical protein